MAGSWNRKGHPIIMAEQMKHPIQWNPMKDEWKACELQISKQPISKSWSPNLCPHCKADLGGVCDDGYYENPRYERCPVCGQRLTYENQ